MRKAIRATLIIGMMMALMIGLSSCGGKGLEKAYKEISESDIEKATIGVTYDKNDDLMDVVFYTGCDIDKTFGLISEAVKDEEIGTLYFRADNSITEEELKKIDENIGNLPCESMNMLGVNGAIAGNKTHNWLKLVKKSEGVYSDSFLIFETLDDEGRQMLKSVKKVWVENANLEGVKLFPKVEEIGICADLDIAYKGISETDEESNEEAEESDAVKYEFTERFEHPDGFAALSELKKLDRILIAPECESYSLSEEGGEYLYALSLVCPEVKINPPEKKYDPEKLKKVSEIRLGMLNNNKDTKENIKSALYIMDVKNTYEECVKFKVQGREPRIEGRALVYMATPDNTGYTDKREFHEKGKLLMETELGTAFPLINKTGTYDTFVYVYPVYKKAGKYDVGTEAYTETYMVQVFNRNDSAAYKPQKVATAKPPKNFTYSGDAPPAKWAGSADKKKIYDYIKKIKRVQKKEKAEEKAEKQ